MNTLKRLAALLLFAGMVALALWVIANIVDRISKHEHDWLEATTVRIEQKI